MARLMGFVALFTAGLIVLLVGCGNVSNPTTQPPPPPTNTLAYLHRTGIPNNYITYDLKVLHSDGTTTTALSSQELLSARLSPNGQKILYSYYDSTAVGYQIATINPDGTGKTVLTPSGSFGLYPQYAPGGSKIVFEAAGADARAIGVMNADGSHVSIISIPVGQFCFPATNGSIIAVGEYTLATHGLVTMNMDGSNQRIIDNTAYTVNPGFSTNGNKIIFSVSDGLNLNLYSVDTDGSNLLQLTTTPFNWDPVALGGKIYFVSIPSGVTNPTTDSDQIFSINEDGSNLTQVTNDTLYDGFNTANGLCLNP